MDCFAKLVKSDFLKNANKELNQARKLILITNPTYKFTPDQNESYSVYWSFDKAEKRDEVGFIWSNFEIDKLIELEDTFLVDDYISVVEDSEVSFLCSYNKQLVDESVNHYHYVYGDWCYYRSKKKVKNRFMYYAVMWKAFPLTPSSVN